MNDVQLGELAAIGTALLWTLSAVAWTFGGRIVGALAVSFVRLILCCVMLSLHGWIARGRPFPTDAPPSIQLILLLSGFFGFFLSDLLLFRAFLLIGTRLSLLIYALTPPIAALTAWLVLASPLPGRSWLAMGITLAGVAWVVLERTPHAPRGAPQRPMTGILLALGAAFWQAMATLLAKAGATSYDATAATYLRVLGGLAGYAVLVTILRRWPLLPATLRDPRALAIITAGTIVGPYLGVTLYMVALRHCPAGVVATIVSTMPVLILPFAVWLERERVTARALAGAVLTVVGVAMLVS